jgi:hypothetical protein
MKKAEREALERRRAMHTTALLEITCNRESVLLRMKAWDAQVAEIKQRYSLPESTSSKQRWLPFSSGLPTRRRTR